MCYGVRFMPGPATSSDGMPHNPPNPANGAVASQVSFFCLFIFVGVWLFASPVPRPWAWPFDGVWGGLVVLPSCRLLQEYDFDAAGSSVSPEDRLTLQRLDILKRVGLETDVADARFAHRFVGKGSSVQVATESRPSSWYDIQCCRLL